MCFALLWIHCEMSSDKRYGLCVMAQILNGSLCVSFGARQTVKIGLIQPASATFYDYYEPGRPFIFHLFCLFITVQYSITVMYDMH